MTSSTTSSFSSWFQQVTGFAPHRWQTELGSEAEPHSRLIRIPTGFGKTLGVVGAWAYNRLILQNEDWPRRLVFCLPMRVLVEQTVGAIQELLRQMGVDVEVHMLMGGVESAEWHLSPDRPVVLVGTQDMLLSRALNRGYAAARARWPMEYGLLHTDCLWVMDEVQLMDVGLTTSVQCQAFRQLQPRGSKSVTWWMSATLQPAWLQTTEFQAELRTLEERLLAIRPSERTSSLFAIQKPVRKLEIPATEDKDNKAFVEEILRAHFDAPSESETGRITLVIVNTVALAMSLYEQLTKKKQLKEAGVDLRLVHSRFRGVEKEKWREEFLQREFCAPGVDRLIISTQVVEAGVDISATTLISELAPWPSLVQRFGRAARYGGTAQVLVVDRKLSEKRCAPYEEVELVAAAAALERISDVGARSLEEFEEELQLQDREFLKQLYPYAPLHVLQMEELRDLFDTDPDLTGNDVDVSRFIRSGEERDALVWWWEFQEKDAQPSETLQPSRRALCAAPVRELQEWLCGKTEPLKDNMQAWVWSYQDGEWKKLRRSDIRPGCVLLINARCGGYSPYSGFIGRPTPKDESFVTAGLEKQPTQDLQTDLSEAQEDLSEAPYKTIATHGAEVAARVAQLAQTLQLSERMGELLALAARWHDLGKAHPAFQGAIQKDKRAASVREREDLAKAPDAVWRKGKSLYGARRGFRHELASALALLEGVRRVQADHEGLLGPYRELLEQGVLPSVPVEETEESVLLRELAELSALELNLVAYLVCSHHGKVRVSLQTSPADQEAKLGPRVPSLPLRGVCEGDVLPSVPLMSEKGAAETLPSLSLSLEPAALGLSGRYGESWQERVLHLREQYGDCQLAFFEALLRAADIQSSRSDRAADPLLETELS